MNIFSPSTLKNTALCGHIRRLNNISGRASEKDKRCGGCAKTTCSGKRIAVNFLFCYKRRPNKVPSGPHPSQNSPGKLFRKDPVRTQ